MQLTPHPDSPCPALTSLTAEAVRDGSRVSLRYVLSGAIRAVELAPEAEPSRADELWRHTCLEAFVQAGDGYIEINLAPSTQWAAYRFDGYRQGMRPADILAPQIKAHRQSDRFELTAVVNLDGLGLDDLDWRVGLSAVVESADKSICYWALKHPPGRPDFHNADCFALELPGSRSA
jgi:hypothetical protein